jgi:hypothetical protein
VLLDGAWCCWMARGAAGWRVVLLDGAWCCWMVGTAC